jgi:glutamyl-tRNA reductase
MTNRDLRIYLKMQFIGFELEIIEPRHREEIVQTLSRGLARPVLVLNTCQRLECFGFDIPEDSRWRITARWDSREAFERMARIAAGLESRIIGELEVLGQVRTAYKTFREATGGSEKVLDRIFQDALALGREARRVSEVDRNLTSLSALSANALMKRIPATAPVAVVGAGSLASSVARYLNKRGNHPVRVTSRCPENAFSLAMELGGFSTALNEMEHLLEGVSGIISATAAPHALIFPQHLEKAGRPLTIVDLGEPPDCDDAVRNLPDVTYISLLDIERKAHINAEDRLKRAEVAAQIIRDGALAWTARS